MSVPADLVDARGVAHVARRAPDREPRAEGVVTPLRTRAMDAIFTSLGIPLPVSWERGPLTTVPDAVDALLAANLLHDPGTVVGGGGPMNAPAVNGDCVHVTRGADRHRHAYQYHDGWWVYMGADDPPRDDEARIERAARVLAVLGWDEHTYAERDAYLILAQAALAAADHDPTPEESAEKFTHDQEATP